VDHRLQLDVPIVAQGCRRFYKIDLPKRSSPSSSSSSLALLHQDVGKEQQVGAVSSSGRVRKRPRDI
uniref:Uncharacterized protein n=1 Tax=Anopheles atroparvus TaxID=41427 RepID=A0AAG5CXU6_ANOAO